MVGAEKDAMRSSGVEGGLFMSFVKGSRKKRSFLKVSPVRAGPQRKKIFFKELVATKLEGGVRP